MLMQSTTSLNCIVATIVAFSWAARINGLISSAATNWFEKSKPTSLRHIFGLLTTADGVKMGKSQKGAIWLDEDKTSPYELFQYMRNIDDRDVEKFLLMLTFLPTEECKTLGSYRDERINEGKERLAHEVTKLVHGAEKADEALEASRSLFVAGTSSDNMPTTTLPAARFAEGVGLLSLMTELGLTKSNGEARKLVQQGGVSLNDEKVADFSKILTADDFVDEQLILRKGKKVYHRVLIEN